MQNNVTGRDLSVIIYADHVINLEVILLVPTHCCNQDITFRTKLFCFWVLLVFWQTLYSFVLSGIDLDSQVCCHVLKIRGSPKKIPDYEIFEFPTPLQSTKTFNKMYPVVNIMNSSKNFFDFFEASK